MQANNENNCNAELTDYLWKNRLILIFAPSEQDSSYTEVKEIMARLAEEFTERDLLTFHLFQSGQSYLKNKPLSPACYDTLKNTYNPLENQLTMILIGKDGGEKMRQEHKIDFQALFDRIDSMPMRQHEIRERKNRHK